MLFSFEKQGAHLVEGLFSDFQSLVNAVKLGDVVICTLSGTHFRSHNIMLQLKLVEAIKEAGNVKPLLVPT
ncbi:PREDICTED: isoflavone reductase homolog [Fragaria vesca subsp. vesca]